MSPEAPSLAAALSAGRYHDTNQGGQVSGTPRTATPGTRGRRSPRSSRWAVLKNASRVRCHQAHRRDPHEVHDSEKENVKHGEAYRRDPDEVHDNEKEKVEHGDFDPDHSAHDAQGENNEHGPDGQTHHRQHTEHGHGEHRHDGHIHHGHHPRVSHLNGHMQDSSHVQSVVSQQIQNHTHNHSRGQRNSHVMIPFSTNSARMRLAYHIARGTLWPNRGDAVERRKHDLKTIARHILAALHQARVQQEMADLIHEHASSVWIRRAVQSLEEASDIGTLGSSLDVMIEDLRRIQHEFEMAGVHVQSSQSNVRIELGQVQASLVCIRNLVADVAGKAEHPDQARLSWLTVDSVRQAILDTQRKMEQTLAQAFPARKESASRHITHEASVVDILERFVDRIAEMHAVVSDQLASQHASLEQAIMAGGSPEEESPSNESDGKVTRILIEEDVEESLSNESDEKLMRILIEEDVEESLSNECDKMSQDRALPEEHDPEGPRNNPQLESTRDDFAQVVSGNAACQVTLPRSSEFSPEHLPTLLTGSGTPIKAVTVDPAKPSPKRPKGGPPPSVLSWTSEELLQKVSANEHEQGALISPLKQSRVLLPSSEALSEDLQPLSDSPQPLYLKLGFNQYEPSEDTSEKARRAKQAFFSGRRGGWSEAAAPSKELLALSQTPVSLRESVVTGKALLTDATLNGATSQRAVEQLAEWLTVDESQRFQHPEIEKSSGTQSTSKAFPSKNIPVTASHFSLTGLGMYNHLNGVPAKSGNRSIMPSLQLSERPTRGKPTSGGPGKSRPTSSSITDSRSSRPRTASPNLLKRRTVSPDRKSPTLVTIPSESVPVSNIEESAATHGRPHTARCVGVGRSMLSGSMLQESNGGNVGRRGSQSARGARDTVRLASRASGCGPATSNFDNDYRGLSASGASSANPEPTRERFLSITSPANEEGILQLHDATVPKVLCTFDAALWTTGSKTGRGKIAPWARRREEGHRIGMYGSPKHRSCAHPEPVMEQCLPRRPETPAPKKVNPRHRYTTSM